MTDGNLPGWRYEVAPGESELSAAQIAERVSASTADGDPVVEVEIDPTRAVDEPTDPIVIEGADCDRFAAVEG
ncbi:MAG: hypothetical protein AAF467_17695 [Actinomycetota bacterium]